MIAIIKSKFNKQITNGLLFGCKQALIESEGNVTKTAKTLNVQRTTLIEKINKYSINLT